MNVLSVGGELVLFLVQEIVRNVAVGAVVEQEFLAKAGKLGVRHVPVKEIGQRPNVLQVQAAAIKGNGSVLSLVPVPGPVNGARATGKTVELSDAVQCV